MIDIPALKNGNSYEGFFLIRNVQKRLKKNGEPYLSISLMNRTGRIEGKVWNNVGSMESLLNPGKIFRIKAVVNEYLGKKELNIEKITHPGNETGSFSIEDFLEPPAFDNNAMLSEMMSFIKNNTTSESIHRLADLFFGEYGDRFRIHFGAQRIHHAYPGGLLKHTYSVIKLCFKMSELYEVDNNVLIPGALFHDVGKLGEFTTFPVIGLTREGGLLGHLVIGVEILSNLVSRIEDFPNDLFLKIRHLVLSHHGEKEFGSPEVPKIGEAFILHVADLLDSKMDIVEKYTGSEGDGIFTDYIPPLGRRLLKD